jgi:hypothetical protein
MFLSHAETLPQALRALADMTEAKIADMQAKADDAFPKPQKLKPFPKKSEFVAEGVASIEHSTNWWNFKDGWGSMKPISNLASLESRKKALLEQVDMWEAVCGNIEEANKPLIENNLLIKHKMAQIMKQLGIPDSYQQRDTKSRAMHPKYVSLPAGWIGDLSRNIPTTQYTAHKLEAQQTRSHIEDTYRTAYRTIYDQEQKATKEKAKVENETKVAFYKVKYGCDPLADIGDVLYSILGKCKYLRLAHYLEKNRGDWSDGYDYAEQGLNGFFAETEEDKEIEACISDIINDDSDIDGRYFRDCEYNYGELFAKADADLFADYEQVKQMKEQQ